MKLEIFRRKDEFFEKGIDQDLVELRFKHFQQRLIDTINRLLEERRQISRLQSKSMQYRDPGSYKRLVGTVSAK